MYQETTIPAAPKGTKRRASSFSVLKYRNYRLWFFGQMISLMGA